MHKTVSEYAELLIVILQLTLSVTAACYERTNTTQTTQRFGGHKVHQTVAYLP
jgi:hypothetical protein